MLESRPNGPIGEDPWASEGQGEKTAYCDKRW